VHRSYKRELVLMPRGELAWARWDRQDL
jgi:hypothetical protein